MNGVVKSAALTTQTSVDVVVGGVTNTFSFSTNTNIDFHTNGAVRFGELSVASSNTKVVDTVSDVTNTFSFAANYAIDFHENGRVYSGALQKSIYVTISTVLYHLTGAITFNADGTVDLANTTKTQINGAEIHSVGGMDYIFKTGTILKDGTNITNGVLFVATPITISGSSYTLAINTKVFFDASGSRIQGKVSATQYVINGVLHTFETGSVKTDAGGFVIQGKTSATQYVINGVLHTFETGSVKTDAGGFVIQGKVSATQYVINGVLHTFEKGR